MRICHLGKYYFPVTGGIETHVRILARAQVELGADVEVVCINHADASGADVSSRPFAATVDTHEMDDRVKLTRIGRRFSLARWDVCPGALRRLRNIIAGDCDILHLHVPNPTMLLALPSLPAKTRLVITHHSDVVKQRILGQGLWPFELWAFHCASRILATSPRYENGSRLLRRFHSKVAVLPFGVDMQPFIDPSPAAIEFGRRLRAEHGEPLWLSVGRIVYYKGYETAVKALAELPGKWVVIGTGPLEEPLKQLARDMGVAGRIVWLGGVSDDELVGAMSAATALWFPSNARSEAFGLVQVEAMASGCPVINCDIPHSGVPWVSIHHETGLTVSINTPEQFAAAARRLVDDPQLHARLASNAQRRAAEQFNHRRMAAESLDLYRSVMAEASTRSGSGSLRDRSANKGHRLLRRSLATLSQRCQTRRQVDRNCAENES